MRKVYILKKNKPLKAPSPNIFYFFHLFFKKKKSSAMFSFKLIDKA